MPYSFYDEQNYKKSQSEIVKRAWKRGVYNFRVSPLISKRCKNPVCTNSFLIKPYEHKTYCSCHCAAIVNNPKRITSEITKERISIALKNLPSWKRGKHFTKPKIKLTCNKCNKVFYVAPYLAKTRKYCSSKCASQALGRLTTSPKASKGKNGIRNDIDPNINFYSTWEANVARVYNLVGIEWQYSPTIFDLGEHTYRPDFYLPKFDTYVEVKNYLGGYSLERDLLFRKKYPNTKLELILTKHYLNIKKCYKDLVDMWEY